MQKWGENWGQFGGSRWQSGFSFPEAPVLWPTCLQREERGTDGGRLWERVSYRFPIRVSPRLLRGRLAGQGSWAVGSRRQRWKPEFPEPHTQVECEGGKFVSFCEDSLEKPALSRWGCSSVVERMLSMHEVPGSIPSISSLLSPRRGHGFLLASGPGPSPQKPINLTPLPSSAAAVCGAVHGTPPPSPLRAWPRLPTKRSRSGSPLPPPPIQEESLGDLVTFVREKSAPEGLRMNPLSSLSFQAVAARGSPGWGWGADARQGGGSLPQVGQCGRATGRGVPPRGGGLRTRDRERGSLPGVGVQTRVGGPPPSSSARPLAPGCDPGRAGSGCALRGPGEIGRAHV